MSTRQSPWQPKLQAARRELERMRQRRTFLFPAQSLEYRDSQATVLALERFVLELEERVAADEVPA